MPVPDDFDLRILAILQSDARTSAEEIARQVGLSAPACYRRIRELRRSGAIEREVALVAPKAMGWPITMVVLLSLERDGGPIVDDLVRALRAKPEVLDLWYVTGDHDLVAHVAAKTMSDFDEFAREVLRPEAQVRSFKTLVVLRQLQRSAPLMSANG
jgi:Lrp/AsnC family leucine-responsive transcriptional regulator